MRSLAIPERRIWFFGGKGGVGKTTCAAATALALAEVSGPESRARSSGSRVLALSLDPAHSLADVLEPGRGSRTPDPAPITIRELDARTSFGEFMRRHREELRTVADRGTYFDDEDIEGFLDLSLPGLDEIMSLLELGQVAGEETWQRIVVDLPPTGHALRLFDVSAAFDQLVAALELMQDKHRFAVSSLTRRYSRDAIDDFLDGLRSSCAAARSALIAPEVSAFMLVTRPEPMVVAETVRYADRLRQMGVQPAALVVNMATSGAWAAPQGLEDLPVVCVPRLTEPPVGWHGLRPVIEALQPLVGLRPATRRQTLSPPTADASLDAQNDTRQIEPHGSALQVQAAHDTGSIAPLLDEPRRLTIFGGKGGVGKTTMAAAMAVGLARRNPRRSVVVLSIDPAHSLGDSLEQKLEDAPSQVDAIPNLQAMELDPAQHWQRFRDDWAAEGELLFGGMPGAGRFDPVYDREIAEQLGKIQPTGLDELQAALCVIDLLDQDERRLVVVDSAPTGHLLRFLESPRLVIDWAKELMHILLKYGLATRVKRISEDLLDLARKTKRLEALLHDATLCEIVVVSMDEPPVVAETERLISYLAAEHLAARYVVLNQLSGPCQRRFEGMHVIEVARRSVPIQGLEALERLAA